MPTKAIVSVQDGLRVTVAAMVKSPTIIPARIISDLQQEFIVDSILRKLPRTASGSYEYNESTPLFADGDAEIVEEFGEIPTIGGKMGERKIAFTVKRALALMVSQEMVNRNNVDRVNVQIRQIRNTMVRTWETAFFTALLNHPDVPSINATALWGAVGAKIRIDLAEGKKTISKAAPLSDPDNYYGFKANTLIIGEEAETDLITSEDFVKVWRDSPIAAQSPEFTGTLPGTFVGLKILRSREMDRLAPGKALLLEAKTVGGIGDERPLSSTPLYPDKPRETWRTDTVRQSAVVIDQPKSALWINGVS